jgi:hypothetical protein
VVDVVVAFQPDPDVGDEESSASELPDRAGRLLNHPSTNMRGQGRQRLFVLAADLGVPRRRSRSSAQSGQGRRVMGQP